MAADEMSQGNLSARAEGSRLAEIDRLADQFNSMADRLASTIASLEAERATLRRFIADASHEPRTPLTALKMFNALLAEDTNDQSGYKPELIEESGRQLDHLDRLTTDLLDLSRLEARLSGTDLVKGDIRPVVDESVAGLRSLVGSKSQLMDVSMPGRPVMVDHDPAGLKRAVRNLVTNAIKFTPGHGLIQVSLIVEDEWASIHVQDEGPGIAKEEEPDIFDRFYRGRAATGEGSGLGLAIVREIATIHDGEIALVAREGEGSHFILRLPVAGH